MIICFKLFILGGYTVLVIETIDKKIDNGITEPFICTANNHKQYVMKGIHNSCTGKILFNELFCSRFAKLLELPIPQYEIALLPQSVVESNYELSQLNVQEGYIFCVEYLTKATPSLTAGTISKALNQDDIPGMIIFDIIIGNTDRATNFKDGNAGNYLFHSKSKKLVLIDHSHVFIYGELWNAKRLKEKMYLGATVDNDLETRYRLFKKYVNGYNPFSDILLKISQTTDEQFESLIKDIPEKWGVSYEDQLATLEFIRYQCDNIKDIIELSSFRNAFEGWKGGV